MGRHICRTVSVRRGNLTEISVEAVGWRGMVRVVVMWVVSGLG